jgi:thiol-disulfide isomerase/thioredoxin
MSPLFIFSVKLFNLKYLNTLFMRKIILFSLLCWITATLIPCSAFAQDGIKFETGSWKEVLEKARTEKKLVFIDVYTSWCGPCKLMAKDIFPSKSVGDVFNKNFINYKIDAEKGEGVAIAKKYGVTGFPTYLFINGDGILFYSSMGSMPEEKFLKEAENAIREFSDPEPFALLKSQYDAKSKDKEFLLKYMQKSQVRGVSSADAADMYVSLCSKDEILNKETLTILLKNKNINVDGLFFGFLTDNKDEVAKKLGYPKTETLMRTLGYLASSDIERAIEKRDEVLLKKIISALVLFNTDNINKEWIADEAFMKYYTATSNDKKLSEVLSRYSKSVLNYDKKLIAKSDSVSLIKFEQQVKSGMFKDRTEDEIGLARKMAKMESLNYGFRLRNIAQSALKVVTDKNLLTDALNWADLAYQYFDNFTMTEVKAGLLFKLGRVEEGIKCQKKAISEFENLKMANEPIKNRLLDQLKKMEQSAVSNLPSQAKSVNIAGNVSGIPDQQIFLELVGINGENKIVQSTNIVNGSFSFNVNLTDCPVLLQLRIEDKTARLNCKVLGMRSGNGNILAENNFNINVNISATSYEVTNNAPSFQSVISLRKILDEKFDTPMSNVQTKMMGLNIDWSKNPKPEDLSDDIRTKLLQYRAENRKLAEDKRDFLKSYVKTNTSDISSLFCLFELGKSPLPFARVEELWPDLFNSLSDEVKSSHIGQIFKAIVDKNVMNDMMVKSVGVGKLFKDFSLMNINGKEVKMSSCLKKGHYILLDFWASWCGPCRGENPNLLKAYNKYNSKGFDVVAVSLDEKKESWMKAVADDKMPWIQLSDLKGWKSEIIRMYGVTGIPANFLLDENGTIVATSLRGEALEKKLEELLK